MTFEELEQYLDSDANEFGLSTIATHGFLTASVIGKPLHNWQSVLFEGHEKQVKPALLQALSLWREELLATLQDEQNIELPFDMEDTDFEDIENTELSEWAVGFVDAMYGSDNEEDDWFLQEGTQEDVAMLTLPMILFSGIDNEEPDMRDLANDPDTMSQMAQSLEKNITELFLLFHTDD